MYKLENLVKIINETTSLSIQGFKGMVDDGPVVFYKNSENYYKNGEEIARQNNGEVLDYLLPSDINTDNYDLENHNVYPLITPFPKGDGVIGLGSREIQTKGEEAFNMWKDRINQIIEKKYDIINFLDAEMSIKDSNYFKKKNDINEGRHFIINKNIIYNGILKLKEDYNIRFSDIDYVSNILYNQRIYKKRINKNNKQDFSVRLFLDNCKINFNKQRVYFVIELSNMMNEMFVYYEVPNKINCNIKLIKYIYNGSYWQRVI